MNTQFQYKNIEHKKSGKRRITRKVHIKGGCGYKSVCVYSGGKRRCYSRKSLKSDEMEKIKQGTFIPGLFSDCEK